MPVLSVVIPVYNEVNTIEKNIERVERAVLSAGFEKEIILIDDHSTDGTKELLKGLQGCYQVLFHERNRGKGAAISLGLRGRYW